MIIMLDNSNIVQFNLESKLKGLRGNGKHGKYIVSNLSVTYIHLALTYVQPSVLLNAEGFYLYFFVCLWFRN